MLDILTIGQTSRPNGDIGRVSYLGEATGPSWLLVNTEMGLTGGTQYPGSEYFKFADIDSGDTWLLAKSQSVANLIIDSYLDNGAFSGKEIAIEGKRYFCRTFRMCRGGKFSSLDISDGATLTTYDANSVFANSEYNRLIYPLMARPNGARAATPDGITYGSSASFTPAQLGIKSGGGTPGFGGSPIGGDLHTSGKQYITTNDQNYGLGRYSRGGAVVSPYHGWRPFLKEIPTN